MARENKQKRAEKRFGHPERLVDMVAGSDWMPPAWSRDVMKKSVSLIETWEQLRDDFIRKVQSATSFVMDNVSDYYFEHPKNDWIYKTDFPCVAPPFRFMFVEARRPEMIFDGSVWSKPAAWFPDRYGVLFESLTQDDITAEWENNREKFVEHFANQMKMLEPHVDVAQIEAAQASGSWDTAMASLGDTEKAYMNLVFGLKQALDGDISSLTESYRAVGLQWLVRATLIFGSDAGIVCGPLIDWTILVGKRGNILNDPSPMVYLGGVDYNPKLAGEIRALGGVFLPPALLALCFANCKKVQFDSVEPNRDVNRARRRAGMKPFLRYHTIDIDPMQRVLRTEGNVETVGLRRALHICRGHFAVYTEERPLFGRVAGVFWIPAHVRGSLNQGVVVSDYRVHPPTP